MTGQQFLVTDVLRLRVQEGWPDLPNLILNPSGEGGAWGWQTQPSVYLSLSSNDPKLRFSVSYPVGTAAMRSDRAELAEPAVAGMQVRFGGTVDSFTSSNPLAGEIFVVCFDADGHLLGATPHEAFAGAGALDFTADVELGTKFIDLVIEVDGGANGGAATLLKLLDVFMFYGTAVEVAASDPIGEPPWVDILGSAAAITIERDELSVGLLTATLYDATLDPASTDLIRPGKRCQLDALVDGTWEHLFTGKLENPSSAYEVKDPKRSDLRRVKIELVASDPAADLANDPRPNGVATIDELPSILVGTEVPFNVNGSSDAIDPDSVIVVAVNDQAKAIDQVAITRDSTLGFAWIDRNGVLQVWDRENMDPTVIAALDESDYSELDVDFDVDRTFNTVNVTLLQINPGTGETEEIPFGPYIDWAARRQWRVRTAEFKVHGVDAELIDDYAADILSLNATPTKRINSVTMPVRTIAELEARALLDLYQLVELSNDIAGVVAQQSRITSIKHRIVVKRQGARLVNRWWIDLGFSTDGNVASPQVTPSPTAGGGRTLGALLRPIGEVTMWFGPKADIPAGWLPCDGSAFDDETYPVLAALLGGAVLPNFTDRVPIGAGVKALGTSGSFALVGATAGDWRAVWFIIRAA